MTEFYNVAKQLHGENPVAITHADLPAELYWHRKSGHPNMLKNHYMQSITSNHIGVIICSIFVHPSLSPHMALSIALSQISFFNQEVSACDGACVVVKNVEELEEALEKNCCAFVLSLEGLEPLEGNIDMLDIFYQLGVRAFSYTWNHRNPFADGCSSAGAGLSPLGRALLTRAKELHLLLDMSHINDTGFYELLAMNYPYIYASHSNCRSLTHHPRNLSDNQLISMKKSGGIIGLNQIDFLIRRKNDTATLEDIGSHGMHIISLCGSSSLAYGLDLSREYDIAFPRTKSHWESHEIGEDDILTSLDDVVLLTAYFLQKGISPENMIQIIGGNALETLRHGLPRV